MKYYLHDSNSFNDEKITELYINFGFEGLGLFYTILEKLAIQEKPVKTDVLKHQLNIGKKLDKCWNFLEQIGLISSNNGETFNKQLLTFAGKYKIKKEKNAKRISDWRNSQVDTKNVTHYEQVCNTPKVNRSKVNRNKENKEEYLNQFNIFRTAYKGTKKGNETEFSNFMKHKDWEKCLPLLLTALNNQIADRQNKAKLNAFVPEWKHLSTWINQRCWEEETTASEKKQVTKYRQPTIEEAKAGQVDLIKYTAYE